MFPKFNLWLEGREKTSRVYTPPAEFENMSTQVMKPVSSSQFQSTNNCGWFNKTTHFTFYSPEPPKDDEPVPPPRRFKKETLYESLPDSLKTEVLVRTKVETDEKVRKERQELCRWVWNHFEGQKLSCFSTLSFPVSGATSVANAINILQACIYKSAKQAYSKNEV